ncbi:MAG: hypothetical protein IKO68_07055 [Oscillospiraceae bacterium]|nr:hypothetical protein [Oscillospiraceae bacterium]MBR4656315.1 hypothetical protein [Oscillospiraceae bacterium]
MRRLIALLLVAILVLSMATVVFANTEETKSPSPEGSTEPNPDKPVEPDSPSTGDYFLMLVPFMVLGLVGVIVSTKKLVKNH